MDERKHRLNEGGGDWTEPGPAVRCYLMVRRETSAYGAGSAEDVVYEDAGPADVEKWAANRRPQLKLVDPRDECEQEGFLCDAEEAHDKAAARISELERELAESAAARTNWQETAMATQRSRAEVREKLQAAERRIHELESLCDDMTKQRDAYRKATEGAEVQRDKYLAELQLRGAHSGLLFTDDHERLLEAMQDTTAEQRIDSHLDHGGDEGCDTCDDARAIGRFVDRAGVVTQERLERAANAAWSGVRLPAPAGFYERMVRALLLDKG